MASGGSSANVLLLRTRAPAAQGVALVRASCRVAGARLLVRDIKCRRAESHGRNAPGSGSHPRNRIPRCRSTSCGRMARSWAATSSRNSAISEMSGVVECLFRGTEVARRWHRMILVTNSPTTPCTFYFLSDRLVIRIIRLLMVTRARRGGGERHDAADVAGLGSSLQRRWRDRVEIAGQPWPPTGSE